MSESNNELLIEKSILSLILQNQDKDLAQQLVTRVDKAFFSSTIHQWIFEIIVNHFINFAEVPTKVVFKTSLNTLEDPIKTETYSILKNIYSSNVNKNDFEYLLNKLIKHKKYRDFLKTVSKHVEDITVDNIDAGLDELFLQISNISSTTDKDVSNVRRFDLTENVLDQLSVLEMDKVAVKGIPTPITELNVSMGGLKKQQFTVIAAPRGSGKSIFLLNFANCAYTLGYNVLFVTIEMSYEDIRSRLLSLVTGIDATKILHNELTAKDRRLFYKEIFLRYITDTQHIDFLEYFKKLDTDSRKYDSIYKEVSEKFKLRSNHFFIRDIPSNCTLEKMKTEFRLIKKLCNIDLVVIDYLNIIEPGNRTRVEWQDMNQVSRCLKAWAREDNIHVLTAAQLSPSKDKLTTEDMRFAKAISDHADWVIGFNQSDEDKLCGVIKLQLLKHRHSSEKIITIKESFSNMGISNFSTQDVAIGTENEHF